jgi:uncharacterized membrane protein (DUF106 family)
MQRQKLLHLNERKNEQTNQKKIFTALFTKATIIFIVKIITFYPWFRGYQGYHNYLVTKVTNLLRLRKSPGLFRSSNTS